MRNDIWMCFHNTHCWGFGLTPQDAFNAAKTEDEDISEEDCEFYKLTPVRIIPAVAARVLEIE